MAFQTIRGQFGACCTVNQSFADITDFEDRWGFDVVPILTGEGIDDLLLDSLLSCFRKTLQ